MNTKEKTQIAVLNYNNCKGGLVIEAKDGEVTISPYMIAHFYTLSKLYLDGRKKIVYYNLCVTSIMDAQKYYVVNQYLEEINHKKLESFLDVIYTFRPFVVTHLMGWLSKIGLHSEGKKLIDTFRTWKIPPGRYHIE